MPTQLPTVSPFAARLGRPRSSIQRAAPSPMAAAELLVRAASAPAIGGDRITLATAASATTRAAASSATTLSAAAQEAAAKAPLAGRPGGRLRGLLGAAVTLAGLTAVAGGLAMLATPVGASILAAGLGVTMLVGLRHLHVDHPQPHRRAEAMVRVATAIISFGVAVSLAASGFTPVGWALSAVVGALVVGRLVLLTLPHRHLGLQQALRVGLAEFAGMPDAMVARLAEGRKPQQTPLSL